MVKWGKLFNKSPKPEAVQASPASATKVQGAKETLDDAEGLLLKKRDLLERQIAEQLDKARQLTRENNKTAALAALRKKKMYEAQLEQIENNVLRINEQQTMLENSQITIVTLATLGEAAKAAKAVSAELNVDKVDKLRDELDQQHDEMRQISDLLGQPIGAAADIDLDDIEAELEGLEQDLAEAELEGLEPAPTKIKAVHAAPAKKAATAPVMTEDELELQELEQTLAA